MNNEYYDNYNLREDLKKEILDYEIALLMILNEYISIRDKDISYEDYCGSYFADLDGFIGDIDTITSNSREKLFKAIAGLLTVEYINRKLSFSKELYYRSEKLGLKNIMKNISDNNFFSLKFIDAVNEMDSNSSGILEDVYNITEIAIEKAADKIVKQYFKIPSLVQGRANQDKDILDVLDDINRPFINEGFNVFVYSDGSKHQIDNVVSSTVYTAIHRIGMAAEGEVRKELGLELVKVSSHQGSCPLCIPFQNKILVDDVYSGKTFEGSNYTTLSHAIEMGLFHKHCKHSLTPILDLGNEEDDATFIDYEITDEEREHYNTLQRINYRRNQYKRFHREEILTNNEFKKSAARKKKEFQYNKMIEEMNSIITDNSFYL